MSSENEFKRNFLATFETAIFMRQGPQRYGLGLDEMFRSFWVLLLNVPISMLELSYMQPTKPEFASLSFGFVVSLFLIKMFISIVLAFLLIYAFAKHYKRMEYFCSSITALNWTSLIATILFMPLLICLVMGVYSWDDLTPPLILFAVYSYVCIAFAMTFTMRIPWEMAGFLTICIMAINETGYDILYWISAQF